jgi:hypothetical protein
MAKPQPRLRGAPHPPERVKLTEEIARAAELVDQ